MTKADLQEKTEVLEKENEGLKKQNANLKYTFKMVALLLKDLGIDV